MQVIKWRIPLAYIPIAHIHSHRYLEFFPGALIKKFYFKLANRRCGLLELTQSNEVQFI